MTITKAQIAARKKWVKALRSGGYQQGQNKLKNHEGAFCCLGVACDLVRPNGWDDTTFIGKGDDSSCGSWPEWVANKHGFLKEDPDVDNLIRLNDGGYYIDDGVLPAASFDIIADTIELLTLADIDEAKTQERVR